MFYVCVYVYCTFISHSIVTLLLSQLLNWLKILQQISCKLVVLAYKFLHRVVPAYLAVELHLTVNSDALLHLMSNCIINTGYPVHLPFHC